MLNTNLKFKDERNYNERGNGFRGDYRSNSFSNQNNDFVVERGDIFYAELKGEGSIQSGIRPVVITANAACLKYSPVITVVPVTSKLHKKSLPTHCVLGVDCGLRTESVALVEGITSLSKSNLVSKIGHCTKEEMISIEKAIQIQNGIEITNNYNNKTNYYSTSQKFETEVFDICKAKKLSKNIVELEKFINKYDNPEVNPVKESMQTLIDELNMYCKKFGKNISLFYRPTINNYETKVCKGAVAIG